MLHATIPSSFRGESYVVKEALLLILIAKVATHTPFRDWGQQQYDILLNPRPREMIEVVG